MESGIDRALINLDQSKIFENVVHRYLENVLRVAIFSPDFAIRSVRYTAVSAL